MGTRGFVGIKRKGKIGGKYNHYDSYYSRLGKEVVDVYFKNKFLPYLEEKDEEYDENAEFLYDGLFCEYAYVYDEDNDRLEIYRGFFNKPQVFSKGHIGNEEELYTHLIFIVDKKIHSKKDVLKAFEENEKANDDSFKEGTKPEQYPERKVINICDYCFKIIPVGKMYCSKECERNAMVREI